MSTVNELRQKFAAGGNLARNAPGGGGGASAFSSGPPPLPAARKPSTGTPPTATGIGSKKRQPLPALPPTAVTAPASIKTAQEDVDKAYVRYEYDNADPETEDMYLTPDEKAKAAILVSPREKTLPKLPDLPSPKLPPPRSGIKIQTSPARSFSHSTSEVLNGGSGDGVFFRGALHSPNQVEILPTSQPKQSNDGALEFQYYACEDLKLLMLSEDKLGVRGASRMGFGTDLQDKTAHDAILKLNDQELKLMETLKRVVQQKIKADKEYATSLGLVANLANKFEEDGQIQHNGHTVKSWHTLITETDTVSKLIRQHAEEMNTSIVDKLSVMIRDKMDLKRQYIQERTKIDTDYMKVKGEVKECFAKYQKAAKERNEAKTKYEEVTIKGKPKDIDRAKERYKKVVLKLHRTHNEYVLSLRAATLHQEHYRTSILPRLLECLQQSQESQITQMKQTLSELANLSSTCTGEFVTSQNAIIRSIAELRPDTEYSSFVENHKVESPSREYFEFDSSVMEEFPDGLEPNAIILDNLTLESVQHTHTFLSESLEEVRRNLADKKHELQTLDEEIRAIPSSPTEEAVLLDLLSKQKIYRDVSREIQDLKCQEAKLNAQHSMLDQKLSSMGDEDNLPLGIDLPETPAVSSTVKSSTLTAQPAEKKKVHLGSGMTRIFKRNQDVGETKPSGEIPIEEEEWYHGALPRQETEELLVNDGDFLVREKGDASGQYVLSAKTNGKTRHFPIQRNDDNMYRLEGTAFPTVGHLIRYQLSSGTPVTKATQACLIHPVVKVRDEHDLRHAEIELGDKLGAGHFGDVFRGKLKKDSTQVAVKTCKETVDAATRRKFLSEAHILKQYNHVNIVKLIGVCTDKHPIYIVMELVPGGDLLSFLRNDENDISTRQMVKMAEDTGAGMAYLESKNCIHRDLAARNCLVGHKNVIKISDFGMSREDNVYTIKGGAMRQIPIKWTAPEAMNYGKYTTMSDVWSFGILLWEIFSHGSTPYPGMNNPDAREKVEQGYRMPASQGTPEEIYTLMCRCWEYHDENRPKFKEIHAILKRLSKTIK